MVCGCYEYEINELDEKRVLGLWAFLVILVYLVLETGYEQVP